MDGRSGAAAEIMERLRKDKAHPIAANASVNMTHFANASVHWAQSCHDKKDDARPGKEVPVPPGCALLQCRGLPIPIATVIPAIDLTFKYPDLPTIDRYVSKYKAAGGIHRPAIMTVVDTLGRAHVQLVSCPPLHATDMTQFKAEDEVRQDAVMEQVFDMTNRLLKRDRKANIRNLAFRTYTVIPLHSKTGIIEFVGNTQAIGDWLKDAHSR
jgi:ataxia telangiectasia mutated family protein